VDEDDRLEALCSYLRERIVDAELQAAHYRELVPDGYPAPQVVSYALSAAVFGGYANALRHVLEELEQ